jgi:hypothetical protein
MMSDTDKDKPWWVTTTWWEPHHLWCEHDTKSRTRLGSRAWYLTGSSRVCDLPDGPDTTRDRPRLSGWRRRNDVRCYWWPTWNRSRFRYKTGNPPRWFVHHVWTGVERVSVRDDCRRAIAEYRATGEVDTEPSVRQHHHGAGWLWD